MFNIHVYNNNTSLINIFQLTQATDDATHGYLGPLVGSTAGVSVVLLVALVLGIVWWRKRHSHSHPGRLYKLFTI